MLLRGEAHPVWQGRRRNRIMVGVRRAFGVLAPTCAQQLRHRDIDRAMDGAKYAQAKLRWWPMTGTPALRHAQ